MHPLFGMPIVKSLIEWFVLSCMVTREERIKWFGLSCMVTREERIEWFGLSYMVTREVDTVYC